MKKVLYGVLAFTPIIELVISVIAMVAGFVMLGSIVITGASANANLSTVLLWLGIVGIVFGIILCIVAAVIFCAHAKKNENLDSSAKAAWITSLITLMFLTFPVYWWKCIK